MLAFQAVATRLLENTNSLANWRASSMCRSNQEHLAFRISKGLLFDCSYLLIKILKHLPYCSTYVNTFMHQLIKNCSILTLIIWCFGRLMYFEYLLKIFYRIFTIKWDECLIKVFVNAWMNKPIVSIPNLHNYTEYVL